MAKTLMIQGTMSNVGKSIITAGLCRIFKEQGYRVAPFKSQNMALNSFVTAQGLEMGRAQVMQAQAAGVSPVCEMNPVLLKPMGDSVSQLIVMGKPAGEYSARDFFRYRSSLLPVIKEAFDTLSQSFDIIVIEGAGSPAEINLKENDIVNMGIAKLFDVPVLLVGDIERGGVFAQLAGTLDLLEADERARVKGLIVNKFRGDKSLFEPGVKMLEEISHVPVAGVVPFCKINLDDEDSLSYSLNMNDKGKIDIAVIRFPRISNFTDFDIFSQFEDIKARYVSDLTEIEKPDIIILPGTKDTIGDLRWIKENGIFEKIIAWGRSGTVILGICGGYQMLGCSVEDKTLGEEETALGLLPLWTCIYKEKQTEQFSGRFCKIDGSLKGLSGMEIEGYEIHMGITDVIHGERCSEFTSAGTGYCKDNVYGTYIHGLFDKGSAAKRFLLSLAEAKGVQINVNNAFDRSVLRENDFKKLSRILKENLDIEMIKKVLDGQ